MTIFENKTGQDPKIQAPSQINQIKNVDSAEKRTTLLSNATGELR